MVLLACLLVVVLELVAPRVPVVVLLALQVGQAQQVSHGQHVPRIMARSLLLQQALQPSLPHLRRPYQALRHITPDITPQPLSP